MAINMLVWENYLEIGHLVKSSYKRIHIGVGCKDGVRQINIREFYMNKKTSEWKPSLYGIAVPIEINVELTPDVFTKAYPAKEFMAMLQEALDKGSTLPLYDADKLVYQMRKTRDEKAAEAIERGLARQKKKLEDISHEHY